MEQLLLANPKLYDVMQKYNAGLLKKKRVKKNYLNLFTSIIREVIYDQLHLDYLVKLQLVFFFEKFTVQVNGKDYKGYKIGYSVVDSPSS